ncbi:MAG: alpha-mannosidase, partial [Christensenellaceae bacterium]
MERQITWADQYEALRRDLGAGPWAERILAELGFAAELSRAEGGRYDGSIAEAIAGLDAKARAEGAITRAMALETEQRLAGLAPAAKAYRVICVAHAHIDMNWMWGFQETASVTVDTFRTILKLMEEYPDFTFSQSQASVYAIIEQFAPALLEPIRARIREGRWEVTASTWVENDKNMASGEAMARHLLYTKRYLARLLEIDAGSLTLDFEPDTFGHPAFLPEALVNGGVRYYYHCRGYDGENLYRWQAPSGASVLVYREPEWYNGAIEPYMLTNLPSLCQRYGIKVGLKVYGVGDHGGGPTRRDLDRLLDMQSWPLMPTLTFGSLKGFFQALEPHAGRFPLVKGELNYVFTGCYTAQSRIKQANRVAEDRLYDAEALEASAAARLPDFAAMGPLE